MVLPIVGEGLVEGRVLLGGDVLGVSGPERLGLVELLVLGGDLEERKKKDERSARDRKEREEKVKNATNLLNLLGLLLLRLVLVVDLLDLVLLLGLINLLLLLDVLEAAKQDETRQSQHFVSSSNSTANETRKNSPSRSPWKRRAG